MSRSSKFRSCVIAIIPEAMSFHTIDIPHICGRISFGDGGAKSIVGSLLVILVRKMFFQ